MKFCIFSFLLQISRLESTKNASWRSKKSLCAPFHCLKMASTKYIFATFRRRFVALLCGPEICRIENARNEVMMLHPPHFASHILFKDSYGAFSWWVSAERDPVSRRTADWSQWGPLMCQKKMGRGNEKVRCDSLTNSL